MLALSSPAIKRDLLSNKRTVADSFVFDVSKTIFPVELIVAPLFEFGLPIFNADENLPLAFTVMLESVKLACAPSPAT